MLRATILVKMMNTDVQVVLDHFGLFCRFPRIFKSGLVIVCCIMSLKFQNVVEERCSLSAIVNCIHDVIFVPSISVAVMRLVSVPPWQD